MSTETARADPVVEEVIQRVQVVPTPTPSPACIGDCNGSGDVTVDDLLTMVNVALDNLQVAACEAGDGNRDGQVTVDEILAAVNRALNGCG